MRKTISVVVVTYNSDQTLKRTLESIKKQDYNQKAIETLVIDGGSTDETLKIAKECGCKLFFDKVTNPEHAKYLALSRAAGKYLMFLDSDESLENGRSISKRVATFTSNSKVKILFSGGFKPPENSSLTNAYVSLFADPFSFFIYGISPNSNFFLDDYRNQYKNYKAYDDYINFMLPKGSILPLLDTAGGTTINTSFLKQVFPQAYEDPSLVSQITYKLMRASGSLAVLKNDPIIHDSVDSLRRYLFKLRWKVFVNVFYLDSPSTGFSKREDYQSQLFRLKKYLFLPFALTLVGPTLVALFFLIFRRQVAAILHPFLTFYTAAFIAYCFCLKFLGITPKLPILGRPHQVPPRPDPKERHHYGERN